jgi:inorganic pyrophosphatase
MLVRPVGLLRMFDGGKEDDKILAVPEDDPRYKGYRKTASLPPHILQEIAYMFENYKALEGKVTKVPGWTNAKAAKRTIVRCQQTYKNAE